MAFTILLSPSGQKPATMSISVDGTVVTEHVAGQTSSSAETYTLPNLTAAAIAFEYRRARILANGHREISPTISPSLYESAAEFVDAFPDDPAAFRLLADTLLAAGDRRGELIDADLKRAHPSELISPLDEPRSFPAEYPTPFDSLDQAVRASLGSFAYKRRFGFVHSAWASDVDDVSTADVIEPAILTADVRALTFNPLRERVAAHVLAAHGLRRLFRNPSTRFLRELRLEASTSLVPFLKLLDEYGRRAEVTHLTLLATDAPHLPRDLPYLQALTCAARTFGRSVQAPLPTLEMLTLGFGDHDLEKAAPTLASIYVPSLRALSLRCRGRIVEETCDFCLDLPLLTQLESLDLWSSDGASPTAYEPFLRKKGRALHLRQLIIARAGVDDALAGSLTSELSNVVWSDAKRSGCEAFDRAAIAGFDYGGFCFQ